MSLSRRRFLEVGSMVAATSAVAVPLQALENAQGRKDEFSSDSSFHHLSSEEFRGLIGTTFVVDAGLGTPLYMELFKVESFPASKRVMGESFALNFRLERGSHVPQGTYVFNHQTTGKGGLLIVPANHQPAEYVAVINRQRPA
jgi:hypothetical protein